jgi:hypothetical protein
MSALDLSNKRLIVNINGDTSMAFFPAMLKPAVMILARVAVGVSLKSVAANLPFNRILTSF